MQTFMLRKKQQLRWTQTSFLAKFCIRYYCQSCLFLVYMHEGLLYCDEIENSSAAINHRWLYHSFINTSVIELQNRHRNTNRSWPNPTNNSAINLSKFQRVFSSCLASTEIHIFPARYFACLVTRTLQANISLNKAQFLEFSLNNTEFHENFTEQRKISSQSFHRTTHNFSEIFTEWHRISWSLSRTRRPCQWPLAPCPQCLAWKRCCPETGARRTKCTPNSCQPAPHEPPTHPHAHSDVHTQHIHTVIEQNSCQPAPRTSPAHPHTHPDVHTRHIHTVVEQNSCQLAPPAHPHTHSDVHTRHIHTVVEQNSCQLAPPAHPHTPRHTRPTHTHRRRTELMSTCTSCTPTHTLRRTHPTYTHHRRTELMSTCSSRTSCTPARALRRTHPTHTHRRRTSYTNINLFRECCSRCWFQPHDCVIIRFTE